MTKKVKVFVSTLAASAAAASAGLYLWRRLSRPVFHPRRKATAPRSRQPSIPAGQAPWGPASW
jgi:hypothetical protein